MIVVRSLLRSGAKPLVSPVFEPQPAEVWPLLYTQGNTTPLRTLFKQWKGRLEGPINLRLTKSRVLFTQRMKA